MASMYGTQNFRARHILQSRIQYKKDIFLSAASTNSLFLFYEHETQAKIFIFWFSFNNLKGWKGLCSINSKTTWYILQAGYAIQKLEHKKAVFNAFWGWFLAWVIKMDRADDFPCFRLWFSTGCSSIQQL